MAYNLSKTHQVRSNKPKKKKQVKSKAKTPRPIGEYVCAGCGCNKYLTIHHVYNKSARNFSSIHHCVEWLCWNCHQSSTGIHGTHSDGKLDLMLKQKHQKRLELNGMSRNVFIFNVGRNYL